MSSRAGISRPGPCTDRTKAILAWPIYIFTVHNPARLVQKSVKSGPARGKSIKRGSTQFLQKIQAATAFDANNSTVKMFSIFNRAVGELSEISREIAVEWKIKEFFSLPAEVDTFYEGPVFSYAGASWFLSIYPNGRKKALLEDGQVINYEGSIGLYLYRTFSSPPIHLEISLGLKTSEGKVNPQRHYSYNFEKNRGCGYCDFISRSELLEKKSDLVSSGVLTVVCRMWYTETADTSSKTATEECSYCKSTLDAQEDLSSHQQKCMDKPIKCPECSDVVPLKNWYSHGCQKTVAEGNTATKKCSYCKSSLDAHEDLSSHQQKCMDKPIKCPVCSEVVALKDWYGHKCQKIGAEGNSATKKCSYCKSTLDVHEDFSSHQQKCMEKPLKCPDCNDVVALKIWYDHKCQKNGAEASEKLLQDFRTIMLDGVHSDMVVKVKGVEFQLHKNILAGRNPYFDLMFKTDMKEKSSGVVTIEDCEPGIFRSFVHFIYTGKVDRLSLETVCDLYETADKYQEDQLKNECLQFMMNTLSVDNFCDYFALALRHEEKELFQKGIELFTTKSKEIARSVNWQVFVQEFPIQANELFIKTLDRHIK